MRPHISSQPSSNFATSDATNATSKSSSHKLPSLRHLNFSQHIANSATYTILEPPQFQDLHFSQHTANCSAYTRPNTHTHSGAYTSIIPTAASLDSGAYTSTDTSSNSLAFASPTPWNPLQCSPSSAANASPAPLPMLPPANPSNQLPPIHQISCLHVPNNTAHVSSKTDSNASSGSAIYASSRRPVSDSASNAATRRRPQHHGPPFFT